MHRSRPGLVHARIACATTRRRDRCPSEYVVVLRSRTRCYSGSDAVAVVLAVAGVGGRVALFRRCALAGLAVPRHRAVAGQSMRTRGLWQERSQPTSGSYPRVSPYISLMASASSQCSRCHCRWARPAAPARSPQRSPALSPPTNRSSAGLTIPWSCTHSTRLPSVTPADDPPGG